MGRLVKTAGQSERTDRERERAIKREVLSVEALSKPNDSVASPCLPDITQALTST